MNRTRFFSFMASLGCALFASVAVAAPSKKPAPAIAYYKKVVSGVPLHVVQIDMNRQDLRMAVTTPPHGIGSYSTWSSLIHRSRPTAAITGTYFDTRTGIPVGSIVSGGQQLHRGVLGTAFTFTSGLGAQIVPTKPYTYYDWPGVDTVLRAGPLLISKGKQSLWPKAEGFRDPSVYARNPRTGVAVTKHGKLLMVAVNKPIYLRTFAYALQKIGAMDAMCLDGGSSTGLYYRGKSWIVPRRSLTNLLCVYESAAAYDSGIAAIGD